MLQSESPKSGAQAVEPWLVRSLGFVLFGFGIFLLGLLVWGAFRFHSNPAPLGSEVLIVFAAMLVVGLFCFLVGGRLFLAIPNRYGSILPPIGWNTLGLLSLAIGIALGVTALRAERFDNLLGTACTVIFAFWCRRAAKRLRSKQ
jgi:hypothetical protein